MTCKGNCKDTVLLYLIKQNRPYSVNDLLQNLHKEYGKAAIQKALDDLTVECKIREKSYGKQKVYSAVQEEENDAETVKVELEVLDLEIENVADKLRAAELELRKAENELKDLESKPETEKAFAERDALERSITELHKKICSLSSTAPGVTEEEKKKVVTDAEYFIKQQRKRKQLCMDVVNSILENYPKGFSALIEEIGIETDEDVQNHVAM